MKHRAAFSIIFDCFDTGLIDCLLHACWHQTRFDGSVSRTAGPGRYSNQFSSGWRSNSFSFRFMITILRNKWTKNTGCKDQSALDIACIIWKQKSLGGCRLLVGCKQSKTAARRSRSWKELHSAFSEFTETFGGAIPNCRYCNSWKILPPPPPQSYFPISSVHFCKYIL